MAPSVRRRFRRGASRFMQRLRAMKPMWHSAGGSMPELTPASYPALRRALAILLTTALLLALAQGAAPAPGVLAGGPPSQLDASGAYAFVAFSRALKEGHPWGDDAIRRMVASPPYRTLIAHHGGLDPSVTPEAFVDMLLALRDGRSYPNTMNRMTRIYVTYKWALDQYPTLEGRLAELCRAPTVEAAQAQALSYLPPGTRARATVYLLADGYSAAYPEGDAVVLDLLQMSQPKHLEAWLAHELHHIGANSLLPPPCADPQLGLALDTLAGLLQEGAATYWLDHWQASPSAGDYATVAAFLRDAAAGDLAPDTADHRMAALIDDGRDGRGPLYRVGNEIAARLANVRGDSWLRARLGDPVGLLRAWQETSGDRSFAELLALVDKGRDRCPAWLGRIH